MGRKIIQNQYSAESGEAQRKMASQLSVEEILTEMFRNQKWHRKAIGLSERDRRIKGSKIYQWKADWL
jgi:hypothetical protein